MRPPTTLLLDDMTHHLDRAFLHLDIYQTVGLESAFKKFPTAITGFGDSLEFSAPSLEVMKVIGENDNKAAHHLLPTFEET
jgi:hypothetical protein